MSLIIAVNSHYHLIYKGRCRMNIPQGVIGNRELAITDETDGVLTDTLSISIALH